jgi:FtsP/CotA-like multicopper oxidase with cupredoxin domain
MYTNKTVGAHEHSLFLDINSGSNGQIAWNHESRTAHPIHIHGYKFVVSAIHEVRIREYGVYASVSTPAYSGDLFT